MSNCKKFDNFTVSTFFIRFACECVFHSGVKELWKDTHYLGENGKLNKSAPCLTEGR